MPPSTTWENPSGKLDSTTTTELVDHALASMLSSACRVQERLSLSCSWCETFRSAIFIYRLLCALLCAQGLRSNAISSACPGA